MAELCLAFDEDVQEEPPGGDQPDSAQSSNMDTAGGTEDQMQGINTPGITKARSTQTPTTASSLASVENQSKDISTPDITKVGPTPTTASYLAPVEDQSKDISTPDITRAGPNETASSVAPVKAPTNGSSSAPVDNGNEVLDQQASIPLASPPQPSEAAVASGFQVPVSLTTSGLRSDRRPCPTLNYLPLPAAEECLRYEVFALSCLPY
ncbi:MAG: hypothetical protein Q9166_000907 [cf. Caloplaca sp. 2 TL-2023]